MLIQSFKNKILLWTLLLIPGLCIALDTQLSRDQITLGDSIFVTFLINNNTSNVTPDFSVLQKDFRILNTNYGNAVTMVNGVTTTQTFWRLQLEPKITGDVTIPAISFGNDKSAPQKILVAANPIMQSSQSPAINDKQTAPVFVRSEVSNTTPYVQSQLIYSFKLYFRSQLSNPRVEIPQIKDMTVLPLGDHPNYQTSVNGEVYNVVEKTLAIFPKKPGPITIPAMPFHALSFDDNVNAFGDPFTFYEPKKISLATKTINLTVRDVPQNYPNTAFLPAKNISLSEKWNNKSGNWEVGTPITRTIKMEAQGLRADQLPDFVIDKIEDVNVYSEKPKRSNKIKNDIITGMLEQTITYIPNSSKSFNIPAIKINWWNTQTDAVAVAQLNEINIHVSGSAAITNLSVTSSSIPKAADSTNIVNTDTSDQKNIQIGFYKSIWFWIAIIFLAAWIVTLWSLLRKKTSVNKPNKPVNLSSEINDKTFEQVCQTGQAMQAQQYLLSWAKNHWPDMALNLTTLQELINDEPFRLAVKELEHSLYANKSSDWNGDTLLTNFQRIKKSRKYLITENNHFPASGDPLPPLNPGHSS